MATTTPIHAAESMHWYSRTGEPAYTVKARDGSNRPATLRDARKMGLVPSVTTIIKCAAAPGLEKWKADQLMMAALTLPRLQGESETEWLYRVAQDSKEQARKAAERGTAIHAAIQGWYEGQDASEEMREYVAGAVDVVGKHFGFRNRLDGWTAEKSFAHVLGFGGKVDLFSTDMVIDFKTKEFKDAESLKTWDEHAMQLAAYREGLGYPNARCAIVYVSSIVPGLSKLIEIPEEDLKRGWMCFYSLLHYWQAKNTYRSSFEALAA